MTRDDELARTATAAGSPDAEGPEAPALGATLGRYRLERELGAGGMGVVHAAFDPDLERRVALKVLRSAASGDEARQRLLREARAMARLAHPNVVVVHEVGSAGGRDYVAMELIDGTTLDEWQRAERRKFDAVYEAYMLAGRGLAAAHAAGLVHRDFKPHNVLRGRDGRVVVTDFGLARGLDAHVDANAETKDLGPGGGSDVASESTPSSLSGLTRTGSVLGTPAYMSPEQWRGETGAASDQFAFCIALWEALAGRRPFRGDTAEALRAEVERGPSPGELAQLPRRVRGALRRGLDPDPAKRWPTMDALLAKLAAEEKRNRFLWTMGSSIAGSAAIFVVIAVATYHRVPPTPPPAGAAAFVCAPPALDPATVWSASAASAMTASGQAPSAKQLAADFAAWTAARDAACKLETGSGGAERRACLDAVLARFDAVARGVTSFGSAAGALQDPADAGALLVDPAVCAAAAVPRLVAPSPLMREVIARSLREEASSLPGDPAALGALLERASPDPCASALAAKLAADAQEGLAPRAPLFERAGTDAERCGDDRVRADIALARARAVVGSVLLDVTQASKLALAEAAVARVAQPDLTARLDRMRAAAALRDDDLDDAIVRYDTAAAAFASRGRVGEELISRMQAGAERVVRARPEDLRAAVQQLEELRARGAAELGEHATLVRDLDRALAEEKFYAGNLAGAHARFAELRVSEPQRHARRVTGHVVDGKGAPVAGATVTAGSYLRGDLVGAALAWPIAATQRTATTDAAGAFTIDDAIRDGGIVAEAGALRSWGAPIADDVKLVVLPTTHVTGHVELHGLAPRNVTIAVGDASRPVFRDYAIIAPVARDGAFELTAPYGDVSLTVVAATPYGQATANARAHLDRPVLAPLALALPASSREVEVVLRSTVEGGPGNAEVILVAGKLPAAISASEMVHHHVQGLRFGRTIVAGHAPPAVLAHASTGDLYTTLHDVGAGELSACAIALPKEIEDATQQGKIDASYGKLTFRCVPIGPKDELLTIEIPPWPRLD